MNEERDKRDTVEIRLTNAFKPIWNNSGVGKYVSVWRPVLPSTSSSEAVLRLGDCAVLSNKAPTKPVAYLHVSFSLPTIRATSDDPSEIKTLLSIFPKPIKFIKIWQQPKESKRTFWGNSTPTSDNKLLRVWKPIPPSKSYVPLGMLATTTDTPPRPSADLIRCVSKKLLMKLSSMNKIVQIWNNKGMRGQECSFWQTEPLRALWVTMSHNMPSDEAFFMFKEERYNLPKVKEKKKKLKKLSWEVRQRMLQFHHSFEIRSIISFHVEKAKIAIANSVPKLIAMYVDRLLNYVPYHLEAHMKRRRQKRSRQHLQKKSKLPKDKSNLDLLEHYDSIEFASLMSRVHSSLAPTIRRMLKFGKEGEDLLHAFQYFADQTLRVNPVGNYTDHEIFEIVEYHLGIYQAINTLPLNALQALVSPIIQRISISASECVDSCFDSVKMMIKQASDQVYGENSDFSKLIQWLVFNEKVEKDESIAEGSDWNNNEEEDQRMQGNDESKHSQNLLSLLRQNALNAVTNFVDLESEYLYPKSDPKLNRQPIDRELSGCAMCYDEGIDSWCPACQGCICRACEKFRTHTYKVTGPDGTRILAKSGRTKNPSSVLSLSSTEKMVATWDMIDENKISPTPQQKRWRKEQEKVMWYPDSSPPSFSSILSEKLNTVVVVQVQSKPLSSSINFQFDEGRGKSNGDDQKDRSVNKNDNFLTIRGNAPYLSWNSGRLLHRYVVPELPHSTYKSNTVAWVYRFDDSRCEGVQSIQFDILLNDEHHALGGTVTIPKGKVASIKLYGFWRGQEHLIEYIDSTPTADVGV